jgi:hypothetical protein
MDFSCLNLTTVTLREIDLLRRNSTMWFSFLPVIDEDGDVAVGAAKCDGVAVVDADTAACWPV